METILRFHIDLQRYTDGQIRTMAKHMGLTGGSDDLRWMLAIQNSRVKAEMPTLFPVIESMVDSGMTLQDLLNLRDVSSGHREVINKNLIYFIKRLKTVDSDTLIELLDKRRLTPLEVVMVEGMLKNPYVDPSADDNLAIRRASRNGHAGVVRLLLADGRVDPSARGHEAIILASRNGHAGVVRLLLADGRVDPSARGHEAIRSATMYGHAEVVRLLFADGRTL